MKNFAYIDEALSDIRPLRFLIAYIVAIPVFGGLYTVLAAHEFYAPYSQREPSAIADRASLMDMLTDASKRAAGNATHGLLVGKWRIDPNSLRVASVDIKDNADLLFTLRFEAAIASNPDSGTLRGPLALKVSRDAAKIIDAAGTRSFRMVELSATSPQLRFLHLRKSFSRRSSGHQRVPAIRCQCSNSKLMKRKRSPISSLASMEIPPVSVANIFASHM